MHNICAPKSVTAFACACTSESDSVLVVFSLFPPSLSLCGWEHKVVLCTYVSIAFLCVKERKCAKLPNDLDSRSARRKGVTHINPSIFALRLFHAHFTPRCAPRHKTHFPTALRGSPWAATSSPPASSCRHQGLKTTHSATERRTINTHLGET